ncbi:MAG: hypothetical protein BWY43_00298 [candidate division WS2 bacterium ADurb.Bin280]|uniref:Uncharacterized protein n=1 Tax=candidate division WS2 bacterium ADurb.Bin280 TaxID=1852829 RepID=A0A1V5SEL1_9BACT|nr:MAG: hypothetical protein BWY43_00298 [candidate division WS2 bacterium ADurb.Bin280]
MVTSRARKKVKSKRIKRDEFQKDREGFDEEVEEVNWSEILPDLEDVDDDDPDYFVNYEPWLCYGLLEDLETTADDQEDWDMSTLLV